MRIICGWNVANSILIKSFKEKIYITPLKLNCLIYLVYSEFLYLTGRKIFNEIFIKTPKGPVVFSVYQKFDSYGNDVIKTYATDAKGETTYVESNVFDECLTNIWEKYKNKPTEEILSYIEGGFEYNKKNSGELIEAIYILNDIINIKEKELKKAKGYIKKLSIQNENK